jgi:hypothetical protein
MSLTSRRRGPVYEKLVSLLQNDPTLKREVNSWHVFLGDDATDAAEFGEGELPAVMVQPFGAGASPESNTRQNSPLGVSLYIATEGTDVRALMALWEAVEDVFFTGTGGMVSTLQAVYPKVTGVSLSAPAIAAKIEDLEKNVMMATGAIVVSMQVPK